MSPIFLFAPLGVGEFPAMPERRGISTAAVSCLRIVRRLAIGDFVFANGELRKSPGLAPSSPPVGATPMVSRVFDILDWRAGPQSCNRHGGLPSRVTYHDQPGRRCRAIAYFVEAFYRLHISTIPIAWC